MVKLLHPLFQETKQNQLYKITQNYVNPRYIRTKVKIQLCKANKH